MCGTRCGGRAVRGGRVRRGGPGAGAQDGLEPVLRELSASAVLAALRQGQNITLWQ